MDDLKNSGILSLVGSIKESKNKYIKVTDKEGLTIMKVKLNVGDENMVDFLDGIHDSGYIVNGITKEEFEKYKEDSDFRLNFDL